MKEIKYLDPSIKEKNLLKNFQLLKNNMPFRLVKLVSQEYNRKCSFCPRSDLILKM